MKTWIKLALLSVVAVMLAACGGQEKIPLPYALQSDRIWMDVHHGERGELDPHNTVTAVYHFDGKGNVLAYTGLDLDLGDLGGKNEKQILELAQKQFERNFYRHKQQLREKLEVQLEELRKEGIKVSWEENPKEVREKLKKIDEKIKDLREQFNAVDFAEYESPKPSPVSYSFGKYDEDKYNKNKTQLIVSFEVQELAKESMEYMNVRVQKYLREGFFASNAGEVKGSYYVGLSEAGLEEDAPGDYHDFMTPVKKGHKGIKLIKE